MKLLLIFTSILLSLQFGNSAERLEQYTPSSLDIYTIYVNSIPNESDTSRIRIDHLNKIKEVVKLIKPANEAGLRYFLKRLREYNEARIDGNTKLGIAILNKLKKECSNVSASEYTYNKLWSTVYLMQIAIKELERAATSEQKRKYICYLIHYYEEFQTALKDLYSETNDIENSKAYFKNGCTMVEYIHLRLLFRKMQLLSVLAHSSEL